MKREDWQRVYVPRGDALDVRVRRTLRTLGDAPVRRMKMKKGIALALCAVLALASAVALGALNGAAPGADVLAHTLGFLTGAVAGGLLEPESPAPKARWQWPCGLLAVALPVLAWLCAWR